ncbi:MAG: glycosyltransferase family 9 protein [Candidatus Tantalella remota]|nr:glycosyltransferase family 9 protein [Candidatus Tantalella remota]
MNINHMRNIDRYCGVPLTFVFTGVLRVFSLFLPKIEAKPKKILFLELSEMGSTILADPAMRKVRKAFSAELFFCIFSKNRESLFLLNTVGEDNIFTIRDTNIWTLLADSIKFFFWTRKRGIDTVVDLELFARVTAILTGFSGARNRVGFFSFYDEGLYRGNMLTHKVAYNPHMHIAKNFMALVNALISDNGEVPYSKTLVEDEEIILEKIHPDAVEKKRILENVKEAYSGFDPGNDRVVLINANVGDLLPQRRWPLERFAGLIKKILEYDGNALILLTGASSEREEIQVLADMVSESRCVNFAGKVGLSDLPVLYDVSSLMVTNDSGPGHFSSVTDMPTFILFGPETPDRYGPLGNGTAIYANLACSPCVTAANHRKTPCRDNVCMQVISTEEVFYKIEAYLKKRSTSDKKEYEWQTGRGRIKNKSERRD